MNKMEELKVALKGFFGVLCGNLLLAWALIYLWNGFFMELVRLPKINFWQAFLVFIVVRGLQKGKM